MSLIELLKNDKYNEVIAFLNTNKNKITSSQLGHIIIYVLPELVTQNIFNTEQEKKYKNLLLSYDADLLLFPSLCSCKYCILYK